MEHSANELIKDESHTEMHVKLEPAAPITAYVDIEIDPNHLVREPEFMKSESALLVKQEIVEDSWQDVSEQQCLQGISTLTGTSSVTDACSDLLNVKHEPNDMDSKSTVLEHMDTIYKMNMSDIKGEKTTVNDYNEAMPSSGVTKECVGDGMRDSSSGLEHSSEERRPRCYKCDKCLKVFKTKRFLSRHSQRMHGTESHKCTQCNKEFKCKVYLVIHVRYAHSGEQYECEICKKTYKSKLALNSHVSSLHRNRFADPSSLGSEECKTQCDKCLKVFKSTCSLWHHKQVHVTESHKCTQCNKEFRCKVYLEKHIRSTHSEKQFECDICKKIYKSKAGLNRHVSSLHRNSFAASDVQQVRKATSTPDRASGVGEAAGSANGLPIKQEPEDPDLDIGPTILQQMNSCYSTNQVKVEQLKLDNAPPTSDQIVKKEPDLSTRKHATGVDEH